MVRKIVLLALIIFLTSVVSAEVWFTSPPLEVYSVGDDLSTSVSVSAAGEQLKVELSCGNETKMIFLDYLNKETEVELLFPITKSFLEEMKGRCKLIAEYGGDKAESSFTISEGSFLKIETDNLEYEPGQQVRIRGEAEKANSQLLEGFFELSFIDFTTQGSVEKGKFETNITLPENIATGSYVINVSVYEKENDRIVNEGKQMVIINIKQVPKKLEVALGSQSVKPGSDLEFKILLHDQAGELIEGEASFLIEDAEEKSYAKELVKLGENQNFYVEKNLSSGYYKIKAYSSGIYGERQFYVEENEEVEFELINGTLIVKNIGNVEYKKAIQVKIGDEIEVINIKLGLEEEKKYELLAPNGRYDIAVTDGQISTDYKGVILTGNVLGIREGGEGFFGRNKTLAWFFIILVLGMFIFVTGRRIVNKKFVLSAPFGKIREKISRKKKGVIRVGKEEGKVELVKEPREAEHSLVLKGQKHDTPLVCIKVKNELGKAGRVSLNNILKRVHENKGVIYKSGDYSIVIFSPLVTKTFKNHVPAVKTALELTRALKEYNRKFQDKIDFGIGVHTGDIVNSMEENRLKFTSLGNTLAFAKKIADVAKAEVLLSQAIHEKTIPEVKADKQERYGMDVFKVKDVVDTQRNKIFVQDFLKRLAEQKGENQGK